MHAVSIVPSRHDLQPSPALGVVVVDGVTGEVGAGVNRDAGSRSLQLWPSQHWEHMFGPSQLVPGEGQSLMLMQPLYISSWPLFICANISQPFCPERHSTSS